jgi:hypothetical protein
MDNQPPKHPFTFIRDINIRGRKKDDSSSSSKAANSLGCSSLPLSQIKANKPCCIHPIEQERRREN